MTRASASWAATWSRKTSTATRRSTPLKKWQMHYITEETLRGYVELNERKPGKGITPEEFEEITGEPYAA